MMLVLLLVLLVLQGVWPACASGVFERHRLEGSGSLVYDGSDEPFHTPYQGVDQVCGAAALAWGEEKERAMLV